MELYDLESDISENMNLIERHPALADSLAEELSVWWQRTQAFIPDEVNPEYEASID